MNGGSSTGIGTSPIGALEVMESRAGDERGLTTVSSDVTEFVAIRTTEPLGLISRP
jgi:hypothetical protein